MSHGRESKGHKVVFSGADPVGHSPPPQHLPTPSKFVQSHPELVLLSFADLHITARRCCPHALETHFVIASPLVFVQLILRHRPVPRINAVQCAPTCLPADIPTIRSMLSPEVVTEIHLKDGTDIQQSIAQVHALIRERSWGWLQSDTYSVCV